MRKLLLLFWLVVVAPLQAGADTITDQVVANLESQGYQVVQQDRTWLGRMWILARSDTLQREVVFNPGTGEILRDYVVTLASLQPKDRDGDGAVASSHTGGVTSTAIISTDVGVTVGVVGRGVESVGVGAPDVVLGPTLSDPSQ